MGARVAFTTAAVDAAHQRAGGAPAAKGGADRAITAIPYMPVYGR